MTIKQFHDDPEVRQVLRGIYPIINIEPGSDIQNILEWACGLWDAGIKIVQLRAKRFEPEELPMLFDEMVNTLRGCGLTVILNDFVELVKVTGADGVHLGFDDFPVFEARALLGQRAIIGGTCRNFAEALHATGQGASYVAVGSVFPSQTKSGIPVVGLSGLREAVKHIKEEAPPRPGWGRFGHIPVCAIAGINIDNIEQVYEAGASMAAVIGAVQNTENQIEAARELVNKWDELEKSQNK